MNASGTVTERNDYHPYGARHSNSSLTKTDGNRWRFSGKEEFDDAFGLPQSDFGARFYDRTSWTTIDPLAEKYYSLSPYNYCAGNPIIFVDRDGQAIDIVVDIFSVGVGVYNLYQSIKAGNTRAAWSDAAGIGVDLLSALIPGVSINAGLLKSAAKLTKWADLGVDIFKLQGELKNFKYAADFGIDTHSKLLKQVQETFGKGSGLEVHHLIEQRFAKNLGIKASEIPSIVLTKEEHRIFTNAWKKYIGYNGSRATTISNKTTDTATKEVILEAMQDIYKDYPEMLKIVEEKLK